MNFGIKDTLSAAQFSRCGYSNGDISSKECDVDDVSGIISMITAPGNCHIHDSMGSVVYESFISDSALSVVTSLRNNIGNAEMRLEVYESKS